MFFLGSTIVVLSCIPFENSFYVEIDQVQLDGEKAQLKNEDEWLAEDVNGLSIGVAHIGTYQGQVMYPHSIMLKKE